MILGKLVVSDSESKTLELVLREMRHAQATNQQLNVCFDPFVDKTGAHLGFHYNGSGWTTKVGPCQKRGRKRARRAR